MLYRLVTFLGYVALTTLTAWGVSDDYYLGGIQVNEEDHNKWVDALKHQEMNTVSVTIYAKHEKWDTDELTFEKEDPGLLAEIRVAKAAGLKVVLIPRVALNSFLPDNNHLWHGMIMPKTDEQLRSWFKKYRAFLLQWAKIAEEEGIDVYGLGSEMKALTHTAEANKKAIRKEIKDLKLWYKSFPDQIAAAEGDQEEVLKIHQDVVKRSESRLAWLKQVYYQDQEDGIEALQRRRALLRELWIDLIADVRKEYSGLLTYAANFDTYQNNTLWSEIDIIGINAYFQLRTKLDVDDEKKLRRTLEGSWEKVFDKIRTFREDQDLLSKPLIFTELGYTFRKNSSVEPWSYGGKSIVKSGLNSYLIDWDNQPRDYMERYKCLKALQQVVHQPDNHFFNGILYWKLSTDKKQEAIEPYVLHIAPESKDPVLECLRAMPPSEKKELSAASPKKFSIKNWLNWGN